MAVFADDDVDVTSQIAAVESAVTALSGSIYNIFTGVLLAVATVSFAWAAFKMFFGGEKGLEQAKATMLTVSIAIMIVYLAPLMIQQVRNWFSNSSLSFLGVGLGDASLWQKSGEYDLTRFGGVIQSIYNAVLTLCVPIGAISFTTAGFRLLGNEKSAEAGKKQLVITVMAVAAICILPAIVMLGINIGQDYGWDPTMATSTPTS